MIVIPMPDGLPHEHLGASHVCKHYLNPAEVWEDLADAVEPELRPLLLIERLGGPRHIDDDEDRVPMWARPHLETLSVVNARGYTEVVNDYIREYPEPPDVAWFRAERGHIAHVAAGLVVIVREWRGRWELKTAYRTLRYPFVNLPLPRDPFSQKSRLRAAVCRARKRLLGKEAESP